MKKRLFGTDGIRAEANKYPLTAEMVQRIAVAYGNYLRAKQPDKKHTVLIGRDPRISSDMLFTAFASGLMSTGVDVIDAGVIPTSAASFLAKRFGLSGAVEITASHNPPEYNGIKFFDSQGKKFSKLQESSLELVIFNKFEMPRADSTSVGRLSDGRALVEAYKKFLESQGDYLSGLKIALDCANGAASYIAPEIFSALGAKVITFNSEPDGLNVNRGGATEAEFLSQKVVEEGADIGFCFDGDADRCVVIDETGKIYDGDDILALFSSNLPVGSKVVATVMSNFGLEKFLSSLGIELVRTDVGDRNVSEKLDEIGALVGGEQSGHIILKDKMETGDGILTALTVATLLKRLGKPASSVFPKFKRYPQILKNIKVKEKKPLSLLSHLQDAVEKANRMLSGRGRVLVRYSGTEPLIRLMAEAESDELAQQALSILEKAVFEEGIADDSSSSESP